MIFKRSVDVMYPPTAAAMLGIYRASTLFTSSRYE